jgi:putative oxidoreductase
MMTTRLLTLRTQTQQLATTLAPFATLPLRLSLGLVFLVHGADKLWGLAGGGGLLETIKQFGELGLQPAWFHATMAGWTELIAGAMLVLGLFTRLGGLMIAGVMAVAIVTVHLSGGLLGRDGGFEYPLVALTAALVLTLQGAGPLSLDALMFQGTDNQSLDW